MKSHPWITFDQGSNRRLTHWEQLDYGIQYTPTRKFLTIIPILLFILASLYSRHDSLHFAINFSSLAFVLIPKLPYFHKVRLFGINKYWIVSWKNQTDAAFLTKMTKNKKKETIRETDLNRKRMAQDRQ